MSNDLAIGVSTLPINVLTLGYRSKVSMIPNHFNFSLDSPLGSPTKSPRPRRRRKKEGATDSAFHHTFVMKLFDRSVDLAEIKMIGIMDTFD